MRLTNTLIAISLVFAAHGLAQPDKVARGKYLVEEVARCQECQTPKLADGQFDKDKWLKGATLNVQPIEPVKGWHKTSPDLTASGRLWNGRRCDAALGKRVGASVGPGGA